MSFTQRLALALASAPSRTTYTAPAPVYNWDREANTKRPIR